MNRFDAMSVMLAVVEAGSLSAGARRLGAPLATVSRKMSDLEQHLGTQLFIRTSRRLILTEAGRGFIEAARRILEQVEEAERVAAGEYMEPRGELSITAPVVFGRRHLLPLAVDFLAAHPRIDLRFALMDRQVNLLDEHFDVALRIGHLKDSALISTRVGEVCHVMCASPAYLMKHGNPASPADLAGHDGISFRNFANLPGWRYLGDNEGFDVEPHARLSLNSNEAAIDAAVAGLGITRVLSYQVVDELRSGKLVRLLQTFEPPAIPVQLVYAGQGLLPAKVRAFLDWMTPRLRQGLADLLRAKSIPPDLDQLSP